MQDSDDDLDAEVQNITQGIDQSQIHGQGDNEEEESWSMEELADYLRANPLSLMAQNVASTVFDDPLSRAEFEQAFRKYCEARPEEVTFNYLKSFRRVRVNFPVGFDAICAKIELHQSDICGVPTNVYLADQPLPNLSAPEFLDVPQSDKMFLISPPPSPPVGWEAGFEEPPHPAPDIDLSSMNISASPSSRPIAAAASARAARGEPSASISTSSSVPHAHLDTMLLLTAFAHHCSQPGQVVEILPPDEGTPSIMVTSVDGPPAKLEGEQLHIGPIPRSPCPPYAKWPEEGYDDEDEDLHIDESEEEDADEDVEQSKFSSPRGDDCP